MTSSNPFVFVDSICQTKKNLLEDGVDESEYNPFLINRALSYHIDTVLYAHEMSVNHHLSSSQQYGYLLRSVRQRKRWSKWSRIDEQELEKVGLISWRYSISAAKAKEIMTLFSDEQITTMKQQRNLE